MLALDISSVTYGVRSWQGECKPLEEQHGLTLTLQRDYAHSLIDHYLQKT